MPTNKKIRLNFIDVFAGAGGFSCGMEMAGHRCLLGVDFNQHAMNTFEKNHKHAKVFCGDIHQLKKKQLLEMLDGNNIDVVVGGPPCQGFSTVGTGNPDDDRNSLFLQFVRVVRLTSPSFVVMENVTGLLAKKNEDTLKAVFNKFESMGYNMGVQVLSAEQHGVPEKRRRTIIIGSKLNSSISFPKPSHNTIVGRSFIPAVNVGDALKKLKTKSGKFLNHDIDLAQVSNKLDLARLKRIPEGKGIRYERDEKAYLTPRLKLGVNWQTIREGRFRQTKYQRLDRKLPSPTIMTHRHSYYHPVENRYLTQREAAALQSFPNNFEFTGPVSAQWRQIGNAVPPLLGKAIGRALSAMVKEAGNTKSISKKKTTVQAIKTIRERAFVYRDLKKSEIRTQEATQ
ncbi:MAG: DNA (cytosine-5)-methyltransferase 1 [Bacteriovoracaceae bacterium]|jgi:DNA (cytosine-5)-methyltransferase 1